MKNCISMKNLETPLLFLREVGFRGSPGSEGGQEGVVEEKMEGKT